MAKIKIGDIFEIKTPIGSAYLHYIHKDKTIGDLIRVLPGLFTERPDDFDAIASAKERYMIFFPLSAANNRKLLERVGFYPADGFEMPKYMRTKHFVGKEYLGWHVVDTATWKRQLLNSLTSEQMQYSPWGVWNDTLLIERLANDWSLEKWE
jgi:hypothetical protein